MTSPPPVTLEVAGLELVVPLPDEAERVPSVEVDLSVAPGFELALARAWRGAGARLDTVCVTGEAWVWIAGLERPLLEAASALVRKSLALPSLTPAAIQVGPPFAQDYRAEGTTGRHWLGFQGDRLVLCSLACRGDGCSSLRDEAGLTSEAVPAPGPLVTAATAMAARPRATALGLTVVATAVAALVLWRRPRPR